MKPTFQIEGIEGVTNGLKRYSDDTEEMLRAEVNTSAKNVRMRARDIVPVRSGGLRKSIGQRDVSRRMGVNKGLARTVDPRRGKGGWHSHLVENGARRVHSDMPAQPFMRPAEESEGGRFESSVRRIIGRDKTI